MSVFNRSLLLSAAAGLVLLAFSSDTSANTLSVTANIAFANPIQAQKVGDVTFGEVTTRPNDKVTLDPEGNMRLQGDGEILSAYGHPSVINLGDSRQQVMNFVPGNYTTGNGVSSLKAHCIVKGQADANCDSQPIFGKKQNTLFIGMDMTISDNTGNDQNKDHEPSFDMSVVYQ